MAAAAGEGAASKLQEVQATFIPELHSISSSSSRVTADSSVC
jgi:hypothetical protein